VTQQLREFVVASARDDDAGQRGADLTGQEALGSGELRCGRLEVGVIEDEGRRFPAEFECVATDPLGHDRGDATASGGRSGEGDLVHARVTHEQLGDLAVGRDYVEDARRQAGGLGRLGDEVGSAGRLR
jgi:hypothetical protein